MQTKAFRTSNLPQVMHKSHKMGYGPSSPVSALPPLLVSRGWSPPRCPFQCAPCLACKWSFNVLLFYLHEKPVAYINFCIIFDLYQN